MTPIIANEEAERPYTETVSSISFRVEPPVTEPKKLVVNSLAETPLTKNGDSAFISHNYLHNNLLVFLADPLTLCVKDVVTGKSTQLTLNAPAVTFSVLPSFSDEKSGNVEKVPIVLINRNNSFSAVFLKKSSFALKCMKEKLLVNSQHSDMFRTSLPLEAARNALVVVGDKLVSLVKANSVSIKSKNKSVEELGFPEFTIRSSFVSVRGKEDVLHLLLGTGNKLAVVEIVVGDGIRFLSSRQKDLSSDFLAAFASCAHCEFGKLEEKLVLVGSSASESLVGMEKKQSQGFSFFHTFIDKDEVRNKVNSLKIIVAFVDISPQPVCFEVIGENWHVATAKENKLIVWGDEKVALLEVDFERGVKRNDLFALSAEVEWGEFRKEGLFLFRDKERLFSSSYNLTDIETNLEDAHEKEDKEVQTDNLLQETSLEEKEKPVGFAAISAGSFSDFLAEIHKENAKLLKAIKEENKKLFDSLSKEFSKKLVAELKKSRFIEDNKKEKAEANESVNRKGRQSANEKAQKKK